VLVSSVPHTALPLPQEVIPDFRPPAHSEALTHWHRQPIQPTMLVDIDLYSGEVPETAPPPLQGELLLQVSNASLEREMRDFAFKALAVTLFVLMLGALFALGLAHGLIGTLKKISGVVQAIRCGRLDARTGGSGAGELGQLAAGIADCWLNTDRTLLHRILINLVSNALRHTDRGAVLIACRRGPSHARIEVWDTGPGIPLEAQASIFDELVQLNNPERDIHKGLGLGLAIVRRTADLLHHPITLCSRVDRGSRFSVVVPLAAAPLVEEALVEAAPPRRTRDPLEDFRVMVVASMESAQKELTALLDAWDCQVFVVADFAEAAAWLASHAPPDITVWEVGADRTATACEALDRLEFALRQPLPAIVVSAGPGPALPPSPFGAPRLSLPRPFRPARLRAMLSRAMDLGD